MTDPEQRATVFSNEQASLNEPVLPYQWAIMSTPDTSAGKASTVKTSANIPAAKNPQLVALGERIRALRRERSISQEDFAARVGLDRSYYGGGERNVAALNLIRIAAALGVEVGALFMPTEEPGNLVPPPG